MVAGGPAWTRGSAFALCPRLDAARSSSVTRELPYLKCDLLGTKFLPTLKSQIPPWTCGPCEPAGCCTMNREDFDDSRSEIRIQISFEDLFGPCLVAKYQIPKKISGICMEI